MKIPSFRKPLDNDFSVESVGVRKLIEVYNEIIDGILRMCGDLELGVNVRGAVVERTFTSSDLPLKIGNPLSVVPRNVVKSYLRKSDGSAIGAATDIDWYFDGQSVIIDSVYGVSAGVSVTLRVVIL